MFCLPFLLVPQINMSDPITSPQWCESQKECGRLRFTDLLVKPMQRLTKYSLLLKAILKKTDQLETRAGLAEMNDMVERFVCNVDAQ